MSFKWHSQDVLLRGTNCIKVQSIELTQLNSLMVNPTQLAGTSLYSLIPLEEDNRGIHSMSFQTISQPKGMGSHWRTIRVLQGIIQGT